MNALELLNKYKVVTFELFWKDGTVTTIEGDFISNTLEREGYTIKQLKKLKSWRIL